jgi:hypothetical protein
MIFKLLYVSCGFKISIKNEQSKIKANNREKSKTRARVEHIRLYGTKHERIKIKISRYNKNNRHLMVD